jgi:hypothetical protein
MQNYLQSQQNQLTGGVFNGGMQMPQSNLYSQAQPQAQFSAEVPNAIQKLPKRKSSSQNPEITEEMKKTYEEIFNAYGVDAANEWLKEQLVAKHSNLMQDNDAVIKEIQQKYAEICSIPAVQNALQAYISMDLNPSISLREQGFHDVVEYISSVYKAGYDAAMGYKNQNDSAKARMSSAVNSAVPNYQSNKIFSRADIKAMSPDEFMRNEKAIFDQMSKGLIK